MKRPVFALIDCNNFFVSCEKVFRPDLEGKPVIVLSSNDGCAVARSNEAKALGIPMAAPVFKYRDLIKAHGVIQFSANFELYGDISRRITDLLTTITPRIEVYSVDESFLDLSELQIKDYKAWGEMVRQKVWEWIGIPVSIGIAPTKTLAKLASDRAKKDPELSGVLDLINAHSVEIQNQLELMPIRDVWGVGRRYAPKLKAEGVGNAWQLAHLRPKRAQQMMGVHGRQMVAELNGMSCYPLDQVGKVRKSIARTRTFGHDTNDINSIEAAFASFATKAAFRLRSSKQLTRRAGVFATTSKHKPGYRTWGKELYFQIPTADTGLLIKSLIDLFHTFYNPNVAYHRAGVWLHDFVPADRLQVDLFGEVNIEQERQSANRMQAVDSLNERYGRDTVRFATEDLGQKWQPRYNLRSPRYTTKWEELRKAKIK